MRTKTLLIAAVALAASITFSRADSTVYSQNIVGYVNVTLTGGANYSMLVAPLQGTNTSAEVLMASCLDAGDVILTWTGMGYYAATYEGGPDGFLSPPDDWLDPNSNPTTAPTLSPGEGFFYQTGAGHAETNTWTGSVVLTNSIPLTGGALYTMVGSTPPIADYADGTNMDLPLDAGDVILVWTGGGYYAATYEGGPDGFLSPPDDWLDPNSNPTNAPYISVGQGFFYQTGSGNAEQWNQSLTVQ